MARRGNTGAGDHKVPNGSSAQAIELQNLATQILAAAREAKKVKADKNAGIDRCPERSAVMEQHGSEWRAEQERIQAEEGGPPRGGTVPHHANVFVGVTNRAGANRGNRKETTMDLKGVAEVLTEQGYDPTLEMVKVLKGTQDPDRPEDPEAKVYTVPAQVRLQFANELLKYVHPQRKAMDVEQKVRLQGDELDAKLGSLLGRFMAVTGGKLSATVIGAALDVVAESEEDDIPDFPVEPFDPWDMV